MLSGELSAGKPSEIIPSTSIFVSTFDVLTTLMVHSLNIATLLSGISLFTKKVLIAGVAVVPNLMAPPFIDFSPLPFRI